LIVDEALSVGDEAFQRKCFARIDRIRDEGATILFVSHSASTVVELCNRAVLLDSGEVLAMGSPKYIVSRYQKLLYSPSDKFAAIRAAIKNGKETDAALEAVDGLPTGQPAQGNSPSAPQAIAADEAAVDEAYFEEGMVPKSTFRYDAIAAAIEDPHIETLEGARVNVLKTQREYVYVYRVRFDQGAAGVRCGMLIKNVKGLDLAGCATSREMERLAWVDAGTVLEVRFRFPCMLSSDTYFMNAGVQGRLGEEDIYLDRVIDAVMFKVIHEPGRLATTTVDLDIVPTIELKEVLELRP
jgi:lipopolysaccharide transport system ATP-binding protein